MGLSLVRQETVAAIDVVGGAASPETISRKQARLLFSGYIPRWTDGTPVTLVLQPRDAKVTEDFVWQIIGQSPTSYFNRIDELRSNGAGNYVVNVESEYDVVTRVASNRGAIGYLSGRFIVNDGKNRVYYVKVVN